MHYYLYEIRNNLNGKIYVGVHKTANLDDGYMGSGKVIKSAIDKHGIDNFTKVILETFDTSEDMYAREAEIVTPEFLSRSDTYNLRRGGLGGFDYINESGKNIYGLNGHIGFGGDNLKFGRYREISLDERRKNSETHIQMYAAGYINPFRGKSHSDETRRVIGSKNSYHQTGDGNSQYGTCWISHELIGPRKCAKCLLPEYIEQGWIKGRRVYCHLVYL